MTRLNLLVILFSIISTAQMKDTADFRAYDKEDGIHIYFKNNNSDGFYLDGVFFDSYGKIVLPKEEFISMLEAAAKLVKRTEGSIEREKYRLDKYSCYNKTIKEIHFERILPRLYCRCSQPIREIRRRLATRQRLILWRRRNTRWKISKSLCCRYEHSCRNNKHLHYRY